MNAKIRMLALFAFSLIGCAHGASTQPVASQTAPNPELASDLFYRHSAIRHNVMAFKDWDGDLEAVAAIIAKEWHSRGGYTDFQQESRKGTRVSFSARMQKGSRRYKVIVQEVSREKGVVAMFFASWPTDLDDAFSKQFEIEVDKIIRHLPPQQQNPVCKDPGAITI